MLTAEDFEKFHLILANMRWDLTNDSWPDVVQCVIVQLQTETASFQRLPGQKSVINDTNLPYSKGNAGSAASDRFIVTSFLHYFQWISVLLHGKRYRELFEFADDIHEFPKIWMENEKKAVRLIAKYNRSMSRKAAANDDRKNRESPK